MFGIAKTSGSGWIMVVLSGLVATLLLATAWPGLSLATVRVSVSGAHDGTAGRPVSLEVDVDGWAQQLMTRVTPRSLRIRGAYAPTDTQRTELQGEWVRVGVPTTGEMTVVPDKRGIVREVAIELRGAGPLGLVWWTRTARVALDPPMEVGPLPEEPARLPEAGAGGAGGDPRADAGLDVVRGVREYVPGDPARLVHWPSSARRGSLVVKELDDPASRRLAIVVDLRGPADAAEAAAARAAGLANRALREGLAVTIATAEVDGGRVAAVKTRLDVSRRLARAVASAPPEGPFPAGVQIVREAST